MSEPERLFLSDDDYRRQAERRLGPGLAARFARVRALVFDADGVLTEGRLLYGPDGEALKEFDARDGLGLVLARAAGLKLAVLSGRRSAAVARRARELGFHAVREGRFDKLDALVEILAELEVPLEAALYAGDDLVDLPPLAAVGVAAAVPAAPPEVRAIAAYVTEAGGGRGAVRELCDLVLMSRGLFARTLRSLPSLAPPTRREAAPGREGPAPPKEGA